MTQSERATPQQQRAEVGVVYGLAQAACAAAMALLASRAPATLSGSEILLHRSIVMAALLTPWVAKDVSRLFSREARIVWVRAALGATGVMCLFHNLTQASASLAALLAGLSPILTVILAVAVAGERLTRRQALGCGICVLGTFAAQASPNLQTHATNVVIGLVGALATAGAFVALRQSSVTYSAALVVWLLTVVTAAASAIVADWWRVAAYALHPVLLLVAASSLAAQLFLTLCYRHLPAWSAVIVTRASIVFVAMGDWAMHHRWPDATELAALVAIAGGALIVQSRFGAKASKRASARQMTGPPSPSE